VTPPNLAALVNPAGGLRYHWRALRHHRRWGPFTRALAGWLDEWKPTEDALLLVGPSAGYCLPGPFLARFATLDVVEPDPLARALLRRRFRALAGRMRWHPSDYLHPAPGCPAALVREFPARAILFCNVLGQLPLLYPAAVDAPSFAAWKAELAECLARRRWASFHDRLSGPLAPRLTGLSEPFPGPLAEVDLLRRFFPPTGGDRVELEDHATADLFPGHARCFLAWEIRPGYFHLIEAVRDSGP
jgi:hypothetical protein